MDAELKSNLINILIRKRRWFQWASLSFLALIPVLYLNKIYLIRGNYFSLGIWKAEFMDPVFVLQNLLINFGLTTAMIMGILIPALIAFFTGKTFCSFVCPYNLVAELLAKLIGKKEKTTKTVSFMKAKYYWLIFGGWLVLTAIAAFPLIYFFSMPGQISVFLGDLILFKAAGLESLIILGVLLIDLLILRRAWCRLICPVGAMLQRFHAPFGLRVKFEETSCLCDFDNSPCQKSCPLYLDPKQKNLYPFCYNCGECTTICARYGQALSMKFNLKKPALKN
ncbi:MAG: 4Fe-4S binding protein [Calditrichaeota bacterium]|nr:4Fe-4S binding protein [Calditrichota bacterium]